MTVAFYACEEGFGATEIKIHIQAHGQMIEVVRDKESDDFLLSAVLILHKRKLQTAIATLVIGLDDFTSAEDERLLLHFGTSGHGEMYLLPRHIVRRVKRTGACQDAEHVIDGIVAHVMGRPCLPSPAHP